MCQSRFHNRRLQLLPCLVLFPGLLWGGSAFSETAAVEEPPSIEQTAAPDSSLSPATLTVHNRRGTSVTVYLLFNANSCYQPSTLGSAVCHVSGANANMCTFDLSTGARKHIHFHTANCTASFSLAANKPPSTGCNVNQAEFTLHDNWGNNGGWMDTYDISLVNGYNIPMSIVPSIGTDISVSAATGNQNNKGVYPKGCSGCNTQSGSPCPGEPAQCKTDVSTYPCQLSQASGASFTVNLLP